MRIRCCPDAQGSLWIRVGVILGVIVIGGFTAALTGYDFVISDDLDANEARSALLRVPNKDPFRTLGEVRSFSVNMWSYCIGYAADAYKNDTVDVCFGFDDAWTTSGINRTVTDGCEHFGSYNLCETRNASLTLLFIIIIVLAVADVFSEKVPVQVGCLVTAFVFAVAVVCLWVRLIFLMNADDDGNPLNIKWGFGLLLVMYVTILTTIAAGVIGIPHYFYDRSDNWDVTHSTHQQQQEGITTVVMNPMTKSAAANNAQPRSLLRQAFITDSVGMMGRAGALLGLIAWLLLMCAYFNTEWFKWQDSGSADTKYPDFSDVRDGSTFGLRAYCLERVGDVSPALVDVNEYTSCFDNEDDVTLVRTLDAGVRVVVHYKSPCDVFEDSSYCSRLTYTGGLLFLAGLIAVVGDVFSEVTYVNGACLAATCLLSLLSFGLYATLKNELDDGSNEIMAYGAARWIVVSALVCSGSGAVLSLLDYYFIGRKHYQGRICCCG